MTLCSQCGERPVKPRYRRCARCRSYDYDDCPTCHGTKTRAARECRSCAQSGGQRIEDKIAWMKDFIARYEGEQR